MVATNKGGEDMQVVIGGMKSDEDCSICGSEGENDGMGKVAAVSGKGSGEGHGEGCKWIREIGMGMACLQGGTAVLL